ncbi:MAG TPA: PIN domain-containing protein, partial [Pirellulales bacterium]|nr:PIN domain-containing protein [Pirellulales bacterium]
MPLLVLRLVFVMVAAGLGYQLIRSDVLAQGPLHLPWWATFGGLLLIAAAVIAGDMFVRPKRLDIVSAVYLGLLVGLFLTYVLGLALSPMLPEKSITTGWVDLILGMVLCYTCISLLLQTKDDFRFIIPYVEFVKEIKGARPYVLDTSVVIDGRIADVVETKILDNQLVMPRFVIAELQAVADSSDKLRRSRGRRGLDILNRLRTATDVDFKIDEHELPEFAGQPVDIKLVLLAKYLQGKIVTNDYNLNKVARLHGVGVINLNDLANALKPVVLPGENLEVRIVKQGEEAGQG